MKKSVIALVITGSLALAGCSSSGSAGSSNGDNVVDRPQPQVPVIPDIDNSPEWGVEPDHTPDRLPPIWSGPTELPPIDNGPEAAYTIKGNVITDVHGNTYEITSVDWHGQAMVVTDKDGNVYEVQIERQGIYEGDFTVFFNGQAISIGGDTVQGGPRPLMESADSSIDRNSIRDAVRARLNK